MKKHFLLLVGITIGIATLISGCMSNEPGGTIYANMTAPVHMGNKDVKYTKVGTASTHSILYLVAWGNGGYANAVKNGDIKVVKMTDMDIHNMFLGLYIVYTTKVYGD